MTISGVYPVLCTPFDNHGKIAIDDFDRLIEFVVKCAPDGCVYPGVASEVETLSDSERTAMIDHLGLKLAGRLPFVIGASAPTAEAVLDHVAMGSDAGAVCAMIMAPGSLGPDAEAQIDFFSRIADRSPIPLMLQNAPNPIGAGLSPETVAEIAKAVDGIRYIKEETAPCGQHLTRIRDACGDDIEGVFGGAGGRYISDELARGSLGTMPASELTDLHVRLVHAWRRGDEAEARRLFMVSMPLLNFQAIFRMHMSKHTLRRRGVLTHTHVRGRGPSMDAGDQAELQALLDQIAPEMTIYPLAAMDAAE